MSPMPFLQPRPLLLYYVPAVLVVASIWRVAKRVEPVSFRTTLPCLTATLILMPWFIVGEGITIVPALTIVAGAISYPGAEPVRRT